MSKAQQGTNNTPAPYSLLCSAVAQGPLAQGGKTHTEQTKLLMSIAKKGKTHAEETKEAMMSNEVGAT